MTIEGETVIVTGGTGALGRAVCEAFLAGGAVVHASYILEKEVQTLPATFRDNARFCLSRVDLTREDEVAKWFDTIGEFRILINIAGGFDMKPIVDTTTEDWFRMQDLNLTTAFMCSREALRRLKPDAHGRLIHVGAFAAENPPGGMAAYTAAKAAVMNLTRALAEETLADTTTVNAILPTIMDTPANRNAMPDADTNTWVPTKSVADAMMFLIRREAWAITGALLPLRGHQ